SKTTGPGIFSKRGSFQTSEKSHQVTIHKVSPRTIRWGVGVRSFFLRRYHGRENLVGSASFESAPARVASARLFIGVPSNPHRPMDGILLERVGLERLGLDCANRARQAAGL